MNKSNLLILFSLFCFVVNGQTTINGKIKNPKGKVVKLSYWNGDSKLTESVLAKDGSFHLEVLTIKPGQFALEHGDESTTLFLYPGDSLYVTLDTKQFDETINYQGRGAEINNYLAKQYLDFESTFGSEYFMQTYYKRIASSDAENFLAYADSLVKVKLDYLNKFRTQLPTTFYDYRYADIVYEYAIAKADFPFMHYYVRGIQDSTLKVNQGYFDFYNALHVENENYLESYNFVSYLSYLTRYEAAKKFGRDSISAMDKLVSARFLFKGKIREKAISELLSQTLDYGSSDEVKMLYEKAMPDITDPELRETLIAKHNLITSLMPGKMAPGITLNTKEGKVVNLADFKGKVVFLDFWATWCGPCMREMPAAKILQDTFAGKDVVFLYVSLDEDEKAWLATMESRKMKGVHVRASGFSHQIAKIYAVNGIPKYYLIGRDGSILNNNPPRPSDPEVVAEISNALAK
jgi:thiol-disulfide isomerase/thioredoxin